MIWRDGEYLRLTGCRLQERAVVSEQGVPGFEYDLEEADSEKKVVNKHI